MLVACIVTERARILCGDPYAVRYSARRLAWSPSVRAHSAGDDGRHARDDTGTDEPAPVG